MFIADEGCRWWSQDYSQIEYRLMIDAAVKLKIPGSEVPRDMYLKDPKTDFHNACAMLMYKKDWNDAIERHMRGEISEKEMKAIHKKIRKPAKNLNFGMCVSPETRLLKTDLTWVTAASMKVGDHVIGFDEEKTRDKNRCYRDAIVERVDIIELPCVRVTTDKGEYICTEEHRWLARGQAGMMRKRGGVKITNPYCLNWIPAIELRVGHKIPVLCKPWAVEDSKDAGWLAGIFDGGKSGNHQRKV
jgi:hypothetical protein